MKFKWLGHACFVITSDNGIKIITDPYLVDRGIHYSVIDEKADIVLVSHDHWDHNNVSAVKGNPVVIKDSGIHFAQDIEFKGVATYHDKSSGKERGPNNIFCFCMDKINICHLGDLGHLLSQQQIADIGKVDILLVPVGGNFTIGANEANEICDKLKPKVVIAMHFKNEKCDFPIETVAPFIENKNNVESMDLSEFEINVNELPSSVKTIVLKPA